MRVDLHMAIQGVQLGLQFPLGLHQSLQLLQIHVVVQNPLQQNLAAGAFLGVLRRSLLALTASERIKHLAQTPAVLAVTQDGIKVDARHRHATDQQRGRYGPDHAVQRLTELPVLYAYDAQRPGTDLLGAVIERLVLTIANHAGGAGRLPRLQHLFHDLRLLLLGQFKIAHRQAVLTPCIVQADEPRSRHLCREGAEHV